MTCNKHRPIFSCLFEENVGSQIFIYGLLPIRYFDLFEVEILKVMDIKKEKSEEEDKIVEVPNPLDVQYKKLNVKLEPLDKTSDDFMLIEKYIQTTHGSTHTLWKMEVENIFVCEKDSLKFDKKLGNR